MNRWKISLAEFDCQVIHVPGVQNDVADGLSRLMVNEKSEVVVAATTISHRLMPSSAVPSKWKRAINTVHNTQHGHHGIQATYKRLQTRITNRKDNPNLGPYTCAEM